MRDDVMNRSKVAALACSTLLISSLTGCGGGGSESISYRTMSWPTAAESDVTTGLTGIRGVANSSNVYVTGSYYENDENHGSLYVGPIGGGGVYYTYDYPSPEGETVDGCNVYSADNGAAGNVKLVGTYSLESTGAAAYGFYYDGPIPDGGDAFWHPIDFPQSQAAGPVLNTYPHSVMGDLIVGNYNTPIQGGNAFIYQISTGQYVGLVKPGSRYTTAYGVWWNGGTSYTIVGGYSDFEIDSGSEDEVQLSQGFIVDYDASTGAYANWTSLTAPGAAYTHFEGITSDGNGGYNLASSWIDPDGTIGAGFTNLPRESSGGFDPSQATWIAVDYPDSATTTADTVFENYLLGVYTVEGSSQLQGYVATIPTNWY
jgi:hypothetical protein